MQGVWRRERWRRRDSCPRTLAPPPASPRLGAAAGLQRPTHASSGAPVAGCRTARPLARRSGQPEELLRQMEGCRRLRSSAGSAAAACWSPGPSPSSPSGISQPAAAEAAVAMSRRGARLHGCHPVWFAGECPCREAGPRSRMLPGSDWNGEGPPAALPAREARNDGGDNAEVSQRCHMPGNSAICQQHGQQQSR